MGAGDHAAKPSVGARGQGQTGTDRRPAACFEGTPGMTQASALRLQPRERRKRRIKYEEEESWRSKITLSIDALCSQTAWHFDDGKQPVM